MKQFLFFVFLFISLESYTQNYVGVWKGKIDQADSVVQVEMHVMIQRDTTIGATLFRPVTCLLADSSFYGNAFHLKSPQWAKTEEGKKTVLSFDGGLTANKNELKGELTIDGKVYQVEMRRSDNIVLRPQEPQGPFPYLSEDVKFVNKNDHTVIAGTLTIPGKAGKYPAVILKGGSVPCNRDGEAGNPGPYDHKRFLVLADYLTRNGIAVLRCDDRGIGRSSGDFWKSTPDDLAGDLLAGYEFLSSRKEIKTDEIGLIGHSEGALDVAIAASQNQKIKFVVMLAGPGLPVKEVSEYQTILKYQNGEMSREQFDMQTKITHKIYQLLNQHADTKVIPDSVFKFMGKDIRASAGRESDPLAQINILATNRELLSRMSGEHYLSVFKAVPSEYIEELTCAVLSLNGSKDMQVYAESNQNAIRDALIRSGNSDFKVEELRGLNHVFQECTTGSLNESLAIEQTFSPYALDVIARWIHEHVSAE